MPKSYFRVILSCCISALILSSTKSIASAYYSTIERFSVVQGLPDSTIYSIKKDHTGFIWLGTPKGLTRFDGNEFTIFSSKKNHNRALLYDGASNIFIDKKQQIWVGTWTKGVALYDKNLNLIQQFTHNNNETSLCSNKVQSFFEDSQGTIWLGSSNGLCKYNQTQQNFTAFRHNDNNLTSITHNRVWQIVEDQNKTLWIATSNGLNKMSLDKPGKFIQYMHQPQKANSLFHSQVRTLFVDKENTLWIGTERGFGRYNRNTNNFSFITPRQKKLILPITRITSGAFNDIWVATQQGLYRYLPKKKTFSLLENNKLHIFPHDDIRDMFIEKNGTIWLATRFAGLIKVTYSPNSFHLLNQYKLKKGAIEKFHHVTSFVEDNQNTLWISSDEGLLFRTKHDTYFNLYRKVTDMGPYRAKSLVEDDKHQIWVAGGAGLYMINADRSKIVNMNHLIAKFKHKGLRKLLFDSKQQLWCLSYFDGLAKITNKGTSYYQHNDKDFTSIASNELQDIIEDNSGQIWLATDTNGIDRIDQNIERFIHYPIKSPKSKNNEKINTLFQSKSNNFYVGTQNGLFILNTVSDSFELLQNNINFINNNIKAITEDETNNLWLTTSAGISLYKPNQYTLNFNQKDGLKDQNFIDRAIFKHSNNDLFFGANNGIIVVNSVTNKRKETIEKTVITQVKVNQTPLAQYQFSPQKPLQLSYKNNNITINFAYLNYDKKPTRHFQYHLKNFDNNQYLSTKNNYVVYNNLPSGTYEFYVIGTDSTTNLKYQAPKLIIEISPPWWQLWWIQALIIIFSLLIIGFIIKLRTSQLAKQKAYLEKVINDRTADLLMTQKQLIDSEKNVALSSLVTGIAHEINTPVGISVTATSYIVDAIDELIANYENKRINHKTFQNNTAQIKQGADITLRNLKRAEELITSFKLISVDQSSEEKRSFNILEYINSILTSLSPKLKKRAISVEVNCPENILVQSYPGAFSQIITNIILNAAIHAFDEIKNKKITIIVSYKDNWLNMRICDNGNGISKEKISRIFDPFFTTKRGQGGSGLGLHIVQNIVTQTFKGKIECSSEINQGCCFHISLLLPQAH